MRPWIALLLCVAASCGGDDELRLVPCASSQNAFDIEEVSTLEDAYALRSGADGIALDDDPGRHPPGSTWRVSQVSVLVMIPESAFAEYPQGDRLTVQVWDGADPRRGEPYAVTQVLAPEALQWAAVTLSDPQLAEETAFRKAWWTLDFTGVIPEAGLSASRYFVGVRWAASQRPLIGASNFNRPCAAALSDFADGAGWTPYDAADGDTCNWPMLRVNVETITRRESCD
jgi:hypothetical protein